MSQGNQLSSLSKQLEQELLREYGPIVGGDQLRQALGFPSMDAFRQALARGRLPLAVFALEHRRGKFALTRDLARWLAGKRVETGA